MTTDYNEVSSSNLSYDYLQTEINELLEKVENDPFFDISSYNKYTSLYSTEVKIVSEKVDSIVKNTFIFGCPRLNFILSSFVFCLLTAFTRIPLSTFQPDIIIRNGTVYNRDITVKKIENSVKEVQDRVNTSECKGMSCVIKIKTIEPSKHLFGMYGDIKTFETEPIHLNNT